MEKGVSDVDPKLEEIIGSVTDIHCYSISNKYSLFIMAEWSCDPHEYSDDKRVEDCSGEIIKYLNNKFPNKTVKHKSHQTGASGYRTCTVHEFVVSL